MMPKCDNLTSDQVGGIHAALRFLAALDGDEAKELNGQGFNRDDSYDGHYLANQTYLNTRDATRGLEIVWKYHRTQLPEDLVLRIIGDDGMEVE